MPSGDRSRGFTYLGLLFALALGGVALAALGQRWQLAAQRERETELLFRGNEIRVALDRFAEATPVGMPQRPQALQDLLRDNRRATPQHWLRRLYADPFTGRPDWRLLRDAKGGITGVASSAQRPALRRHDLPESVSLAASAATPARVSDWEFVAGTAGASTGTSTGTSASTTINTRTTTTTKRDVR